jgi:MFS family permease
MPFPWRRTFLIALGFFGISLIWPVYKAYVPVFLDHLGLSALLVGFFTSFDSYANLFIQPTVGTLSDRTRTRIGRRKPFMLIGAPVAALAFVSIPFMDSLPLLVAAIVVTVVAMALFRAPTVALLGDLFPSAWRSRANGVINLMGGLAGAIALFAGGALYKSNHILPFLVMAVGMLLAVGFVILFIREPPEAYSGAARPVPEPNMPLRTALRRALTGQDRSLLAILAAIFCWSAAISAMQDFFTLYGRDVLGIDAGTAAQMLTLFAAAAVLFAIPGGLLATRFGRRRTVSACLIVLAVLFAAAYGTTSLLFDQIMLVIAGAAYTTVIVSALPMVLDAAPTDDTGTYTGVYYVFGATAGIVGPPLAGWLIDVTGTYRSVFLFGPIFMTLALILILRNRGGEAQPVGAPVEAADPAPSATGG